MTRRTLVALVGCLVFATTGCLGIPEEGPVVQTESAVDAGEQLGYFNDPRPPTPGESPTDIVRHFLDAQAAIPLQTNTAAEFLTKDAAAAWRPRRTITYVDASLPVGSNQITVELSGANQISSRGSWLGPLPSEAEQLTFLMRREDGEWRIDDVPDALIVPESWFSQAFRRVSLYFFDPTARILVPEPVYVPRGEPLATALVGGLLQGPVERRGRVARTFVPPGLEVDLSVTVSDDNVAEVALTGGTTVPTQQDADLMLAQLAHTLGQDPRLTGFRVSIDGEPVTLDSGATTFAMDHGDEHDPTGAQATSLLFGLREGRLVAGSADGLDVTDGPMGASDLGVRSVGVNLGGTQVAGVAKSGDRVLITEVHTPDAPVTEVASGAHDLLPPVWDFADRLWLLDRTPSGARLAVVRGNRPDGVRIPGVSGRDVSHFLVSRDGSRLVAVVDGGTHDRVVVSRIEYDGRGRVRGGSRLREVAWDDITRLSVIDIGWSSPTSLVVLHRLSGYLSQVRTMLVDGAPAGLTGISTTLQQRPRAVVSSPAPTEPVHVRSRAGLIDVLSGSQLVVADPETSFLTYAG